MTEEASSTPWTSLVDSRFSGNALPRGSRQLNLQALDSELENIQKALVRARRMRNMSAGPCVLPPEVLTYVFECLQVRWPPKRVSCIEDDPVFHAGWLCVTHVCHFWRQIAINSPSLWSNPTINVAESIPFQYIPDFLIRSRSNVFRHLFFFWDGEKDEIVRDPVTNAWLSPAVCRRVGFLELWLEWAMVKFVAARLPHPQEMGHLRELYIAVNGGSGSLEEDLPAAFRDLTGLTRLSLYRCRLPSESAILSSRLTYLSLGTVAGCLDTFDQYKELMARLHCLEFLDVDNVPRLDAPLQDFPTLDMPPTPLRLQVQSIENILTGMKFMTSIKAPRSCCIDFESYTNGSNTADTPILQQEFGRLCSALSFRDYNFMEAQQMELGEFGIRVLSVHIRHPPGTHVERIATLTAAKPTINTLAVWTGTPRRMHMSFILQCLSFLALENLHTLSLDALAMRTIERDNLWPMLLPATGIHRLGLVGTAAPRPILENLINALRGVHPAGNGSNGMCALFPSLQTLAIPLTSDETRHAGVIIGFVGLVQARKDHGTPLKHLITSKKAEHWAIWTTLRTSLTITFLDYPRKQSPVSF